MRGQASRQSLTMLRTKFTIFVKPISEPYTGLDCDDFRKFTFFVVETSVCDLAISNALFAAMMQITMRRRRISNLHYRGYLLRN